MVLRTNATVLALLLAMSTIICSGAGARAADGSWQVGKASGEVWVTNQGVQRASVTRETTIHAGDQIMTGQNGRVLLVRGEETILISPNTVIAVSDKNVDGMTTTILQRAGSILLEVEKRKVKHFEVDTPYLAAVVKGTKFSVSLDDAGSHVAVFRGQVEVSSHKSGDIAEVTPGQAATVPAKGASPYRTVGVGPVPADRERRAAQCFGDGHDGAARRAGAGRRAAETGELTGGGVAAQRSERGG